MPALLLVFSMTVAFAPGQPPTAPPGQKPPPTVGRPSDPKPSTNQSRTDTKALQDLARKATAELAKSGDPQMQAASCELLVEQNDSGCVGAAVKAAPGSSARLRLARAKRQAQAGDDAAIDELRRLTADLSQTDPLLAIEAAAALPGDEGSAQLQGLVDSGQPEVRAAAAAALASKDPEFARSLVKKAQSGEAKSDVGFQAALGLAREGDARQLEQVGSWLPQLYGRDRLQAASVLAKNHDSAGARALMDIARNGDDEMLRLQAAEALLTTNPEVAADVVERGLRSQNVWVKGQAADLAARLGPDWADRVKTLLADESSWVRLRAAAGVLRK